jgi:hypothetical protein
MVGLDEEALELTGRNVRRSLVLTALAQTLGLAMRGQNPGSLYVPLPDMERSGV